MGRPSWRSWGLDSDAAPEAVSVGRLKVVCAENAGRR